MNHHPERTYDAGAQSERTALAWTRTGLALLVAVVGASRLAAEHFGVAAVVFGVATTPVAAAILVLAHRRYRAAQRSLHAGKALPDGRLPALATAVALLLAVLAIAYTAVA